MSLFVFTTVFRIIMQQQQDSSVHCIILCGGSGKRLWPLSDNKRPKQFHALQRSERNIGFDSRPTLLQRTVQRAFRITQSLERVHCVCSALHASIVVRQAPGVNLIVEASPRDTAPAIVLAMRHVPADSTVIIMPADHLFDEQKFHQCVSDTAVPCAQKTGSIVTLGIKPLYAATGFGYIEIESQERENTVCPVLAFHEKPCAALAQAYVEDGKHYWNAGVFVATVATLFDEFKRHSPTMLSESDTTKLSFDHAVMEHTQKARMVVFDGDWDDLGSWSDVYAVNSREQAKNEVTKREKNVILGSGSVHCDNACDRNLVYSNSKATVALCNVSDVVVVVGDNGNVLVMHNSASSSQNLKSLVQNINDH